MRFLLGGMAAAGVVAAHLLAYLIAVPDPHLRAHVLESTGHGNWRFVTALAVGALVAGLLRYVVGSFSARSAGRPRAVTLAARLALLQVGGFLAIESMERLSVGGDFAGLLSEPAILLGTFLQIALAVLGAILLVVLARAIRRVLSRRREPHARRLSIPPFAARDDSVRRWTVGTGAGTLRGPPLLSV